MNKQISIFLVLLLFGFTAQSISAQATLYTVTLTFSRDGKIFWTATFTVEIEKVPVVINVPKCLYDLIVKYFGTDTFTTPFTLSWSCDGHTFTLQVTSSPEDLTIVFKPLFPCDTNGDRRIDISDLALIGKAYGSRAEEPLYNFFADVNIDGRIWIRDLAMTCKNYGRVCP